MMNTHDWPEWVIDLPEVVVNATEMTASKNLQHPPDHVTCTVKNKEVVIELVET